MAGGFGGSDDDFISGINVTPLVDVVLVLLVIFLITAPVIYQSAIKVQLPKAQTGEEKGAPSAFQFTLGKDGAIAWNEQKMDWETLERKLGEQHPSEDQTASV